MRFLLPVLLRVVVYRLAKSGHTRKQWLSFELKTGPEESRKKSLYKQIMLSGPLVLLKFA